uniref:Uncharacterized protein n=1 Tax=Oryza rufipogon TaxID=4529 RepID=A0A0E0MUW3_ORYRU
MQEAGGGSDGRRRCSALADKVAGVGWRGFSGAESWLVVLLLGEVVVGFIGLSLTWFVTVNNSVVGGLIIGKILHDRLGTLPFLELLPFYWLVLGLVEFGARDHCDASFCWCLEWSRSCLAGCGKLGNDNPLAPLLLLFSWRVYWVGVWWSRSCLPSDKLGNDNPLPLSSVALW